MATLDKTVAPSQPEDYGAEVLCASWNPQVAAIAEPVGLASREFRGHLPAGDADAFLKQFYRSQKS